MGVCNTLKNIATSACSDSGTQNKFATAIIFQKPIYEGAADVGRT